MKYRILKLLILGIYLLAQYTAICQQKELDSKNIFLKSFDAIKGLSSTMTNCMLEDSKGFIWVGTQDGLNRFDGRQFMLYSTGVEKNHLLSGNDIKAIVEDSAKGYLWVASTGGLDVIDPKNGSVVKTWFANTEYDGVLLPSVNSIVHSGNKLWLGTINGVYFIDLKLNKLIIHNLQSGTKTDPTNFSLQNITDQLKIDNDNRLWILGANLGLQVFDATTNKLIFNIPLTKLSTASSHSIYRFKTLLFPKKNTAIISSDSGFWEITIKGKEISAKPYTYISPAIKSSEIVGGCFEEPDRLYYITKSNIYLHYPFSHSGTIFKSNDKELPNNIQSDNRKIFIDRNRNIWLAKNSSLLCFNPSLQYPINYYQTSSHDLRLSRLYAIYPTQQYIYVGGQDGLAQINITTEELKLIEKTNTIFMIDSCMGRLWVSGDKGTFVLEAGKRKKLSDFYTGLEILENEQLNSVTESGDSLVFFASESGRGVYLYHVQKKKLTHLDSILGTVKLPSPIIGKIQKTWDGKILIVMDDAIGIYNTHSNKLNIISYIDRLTGQPLKVLMDFSETKLNYWVACYGFGILAINKRTNDVKVYNYASGFSNLGFYKVLSDNQNHVVATSNKGLYLLSDDGTEPMEFNLSDGLQTENFEEGAGYYLSGKYYAGGLNGLSIIDSSFIYKTTSSYNTSIVSSSISFDGRIETINITSIESINIRPGFEQLTFQLAGFNFLNPEKQIYEYQLLPLQTKWLALGNENKINLISIQPDTYTLQARSKIKGGQWTYSKTLTLIFLPKWYQTLWFKLLLVATGIGIGYGIYRYRLHQLQREEGIRTRIAADLHDDIGSTLTSVRIFTDLGLAKNSTEHLPMIRQGIQEASSSLRDIIWVLDKSNNNAKQLLDRVGRFALPLTLARDIQFNMVEDDGLETIILKMEQRRDLYLIMKEFITNSLKYGQCRQITLTAHKKDKLLHIILEEDGIGFNPDTISRGNGLNNMEARAKKAGYSPVFTSTVGQGTRLLLSPS